ncbi:NUMOD4 domain-containing protein [Mammaliicoccus sciuri]|uniref:NUMOD4 domain-containing protein n=1 Tax=Mammaliicoccus sciuri TaxID=1296 RepID=UPI002B26138A|nr:NUMOD4 domain-containing protein [Mammaliicoccus sciuri]MEB8104322.1 NUMOD4 domain-containing protein [Mammaliicoccus sciuri]WQJ70526.1 NUMOD4 domain-containing protein [Mammaliicoccus sciuri]
MIWKDIPGYEGLYEISDTGIVRSKPRETKRKDGIKYYRDAKIIKTYLSMGYKRLCLYKNGKQKQFLVHRLVALTFINKEYGKDLINHKDANKLNNNAKNLEWCTYKENNQHARKLGLYPIYKPSEMPKAKLTNSDVIYIRKHCTNKIEDRIKFAEMYGVKQHTIYCILTYRTWKHVS